MVYEPLKPLAAYVGPARPRMLLIGEAWGADEESAREPFVGSSGKELFTMLGEARAVSGGEGVDESLALHARISESFIYGSAWIRHRGEWLEREGVGLTNVLNLRPLANNLDNVTMTKKELKDARLEKDYPQDWPALVRGRYLEPQFAPEIARLALELEQLQPNLIIALGNTPCWALLRVTAISSIRGATTYCVWPSGSRYKVLPTFHPASVLYQWSNRVIVVADLIKAFREAQFPEVRRPRRRVLIDPTIEEVEAYCEAITKYADIALSPVEIGADCETEKGQMSMTCLAPSQSEAIVIPFIDRRKVGWSYWPDIGQEYRALSAIARVYSHPNVRLVGQNFIYDLQYKMPLGLTLSRTPEDTMMLHHSMYPELNKGLGFLGSIYTDEASWKLMRTEKADTEKRDE